MEQRKPAYCGDKPYIFISYAHRDSDRVLPIVDRLIAEGYRVWYDEGILPGAKWDDNIAEKLIACRCFLAFPSKNYFASTNCRDELSLARAQRINMTLIYLEDVELTPGMKLRYNRFQALFRHRSSEDEVIADISKMEGIGQTKEDA